LFFYEDHKNLYFNIYLGEDFVNEFIMFSYDVPLSKHFGFKKYATFTERFRRVLKTQPGFNDLTDRDQVWLVRKFILSHF